MTLLTASFSHAQNRSTKSPCHPFARTRFERFCAILIHQSWVPLCTFFVRLGQSFTWASVIQVPSSKFQVHGAALQPHRMGPVAFASRRVWSQAVRLCGIWKVQNKGRIHQKENNTTLHCKKRLCEWSCNSPSLCSFSLYDDPVTIAQIAKAHPAASKDLVPSFVSILKPATQPTFFVLSTEKGQNFEGLLDWKANHWTSTSSRFWLSPNACTVAAGASGNTASRKRYEWLWWAPLWIGLIQRAFVSVDTLKPTCRVAG